MFHVSAIRSRKKRVSVVATVVVAALATLFATMQIANAANQPAPGANMSTACADNWPGAPTLPAFTYFHVLVNGKQVSTSDRVLDSYIHEGDKVSINFELKAQCANTYVAVNYYEAPEDHFVAADASKQKLYARADGTFPAGKAETLDVFAKTGKTVPACYYQIDINTGFAYQPGDYRLDNMGRLEFAATGGNNKCGTPAATTTTVKPKPTTTTTVKSTTTTTVKATTTTTVKPTTTTSTTVPVVNVNATVAQACATDTTSWNLVFDNSTSTKAQTFSVTSGGKAVGKDVTVAAGKTQTVSYKFADYQVLAGKSIPLVVTAAGKTFNLSATNNCVMPEAIPANVCTTDAQGTLVTYTNNGKVDETFTLTYNGKAIGTPVTIKGGDATPVPVSYSFDDLGLAFGQSGNVVISANGTVLATQPVANNCEHSTVTVVAACNTAKGQGAVLTFVNTGKLDETFTVTRDNTELTGSPVSVPAGQTIQQVLNLADDEVANLVITNNLTGEVTTQSTQVHCTQVSPTTILNTTTSTTVPQTQVLGEQVSKPQLAFTGMNTVPFIEAGSVLVLIGVGLLALARRFRYNSNNA